MPRRSSPTGSIHTGTSTFVLRSDDSVVGRLVSIGCFQYGRIGTDVRLAFWRCFCWRMLGRSEAHQRSSDRTRPTPACQMRLTLLPRFSMSCNRVLQPLTPNSLTTHRGSLVPEGRACRSRANERVEQVKYVGTRKFHEFV